MNELEKIVLEEEKLEHEDSAWYSFVLWESVLARFFEKFKNQISKTREKSPGYALVLLFGYLVLFILRFGRSESKKMMLKPKTVLISTV